MNNYVIIGGSKGIGAALCEQLLTDSNNAVYCLSRTAPSHGAHYIPFDVSSDDIDMTQLPETITGFAYCVGSITLKSFKSIKEEQYLEDFHINVLGAVKCIKTVLSRMQQGSSIVLFSTVAVQLGMPFHASVAIAKGAIEGLTRSLAAELAPNIRVNAIAPSLTDTPLAAGLLSNDEKKERSKAMHPLKRYGSAEDVANVAAMLLNPANGWITGQVIGVDGGLSAVKA